MSIQLPSVAIGTILLGVCIIAAYTRRLGARKPPYPPGPQGYPYFGLINPPSKKAFLTYIEWGKEYGDLIHFTRFGQHYLILNSMEAVDDILQKNARFTSDRPTWSRLDQISRWGRLLVMSRYTDEWRKDRKIFHQNFRPEVAPQFYPSHVKTVDSFVSDLTTSKMPLLDQIATLANKSIFSAVYGLEISTNKDDMAQSTREVVELTEVSLVPGWDAFKYLPLLHLLPSWFPGGHIRASHRRLQDVFEEVYNRPWNLMMNAMETETNQSALLPTLLSDSKADPSSEEYYRWKEMGGQAIVAGADTTMTTVAVFFLAMSLYPEVQAKAQEELDNVIGFGKQPTFEDRPSLPYIEAVFREVFRWNPVIPMGIPHATTDDIYHDKYFIPKGTIIFPNIWAITHNPKVVENPDVFIPERHLRADGQFDSISTVAAFGFGRRICVGRYMANDLIWLTVASVLANTKISPLPNVNHMDFFIDGAFCVPKSLDFTVSRRF